MSLGQDTEYIAYIDESGDDGLNRIRPIDRMGGTEWFLMGAVIVRKEWNDSVPDWVHEIGQKIRLRQRPDLHFRHLAHEYKYLTCQDIGKRALRAFVVASNKMNMRGYVSSKAARVSSSNWFYCWITRLLLERITHFVRTDSLRRYGRVKKIRLIYSMRGGHSYSQMDAYYHYLRSHPLHITQGVIQWDVMEQPYFHVAEHKTSPGLQIADIVSGAFFSAVETSKGLREISYAKKLLPVLGKHDGLVAGYGLKLMPHTLASAKLTPDQAEIFRLTGYPNKVWFYNKASNFRDFQAAETGQTTWEATGLDVDLLKSSLVRS